MHTWIGVCALVGSHLQCVSRCKVHNSEASLASCTCVPWAGARRQDLALIRYLFPRTNRLALRTFPSDWTKFLWKATRACGWHKVISRFAVTLKWYAICRTVNSPLPVTDRNWPGWGPAKWVFQLMWAGEHQSKWLGGESKSVRVQIASNSNGGPVACWYILLECGDAVGTGLMMLPTSCDKFIYLLAGGNDLSNILQVYYRYVMWSSDSSAVFKWQQFWNEGTVMKKKKKKRWCVREVPASKTWQMATEKNIGFIYVTGSSDTEHKQTLVLWGVKLWTQRWHIVTYFQLNLAGNTHLHIQKWYRATLSFTWSCVSTVSLFSYLPTPGGNVWLFSCQNAPVCFTSYLLTETVCCLVPSRWCAECF